MVLSPGGCFDHLTNLYRQMMSELVTPLYTPFYCEENVWQLLQEPHLAARENFAVFISNPSRCCPLWSQRAAPEDGAPVFWDYHVIVASLRPGHPCEIWDQDHAHGFPLPLTAWWQNTFPFLEQLPPEFLPWFRVITAREYIERFSSNRAHMIDSQGFYQSPPPEWPRIGEGEGNLQAQIEMTRHHDQDALGEVLDHARFLKAMQ